MQDPNSTAARSPEVVLLVTAEGRVLYISPSSASVFGCQPAEMVGLDAFELVHPGDKENARRALRAVLKRPPGPRRAKVRMRRKDGEWRPVSSAVSNFLDEPRIGAIVMSIREIRAGKTQRHNILRPRGELVAANARLEDFAYAMAHDLREPLRTISMFTELLLEDSDLKSGSKVQARFIMDGVARMSALLEGLHTFAQSGFDDAPRLFELGDTLAEVLKNLAHAIKTSGAAITAGPLPAVEGVERHLVRVFQNLIVNSIKYRSEAPVEIHVSAERLGPEWIIKFKDNGVGIDQDQHDRVFELFKRLHGHEAPGAGIGLAICKKIVEAMGGTIWIESNAGSGATFCFTIPVAEHAASSAAGNDEAVSARAPVPARRFFAPGLCRTTQGNCMTNRVNDTER